MKSDSKMKNIQLVGVLLAASGVILNLIGNWNNAREVEEIARTVSQEEIAADHERRGGL